MMTRQVAVLAAAALASACGAATTTAGAGRGSEVEEELSADVCPTGRGECDGDPESRCETALRSDPSACGVCGRACPEGVPCRDGRCVGVARLAAGDRHTCAPGPESTLLCWGDSRAGQIGDGSHESRLGPAVVFNLPPPVEVVAGESHTCARTSDGRVHCWGAGGRGQLGVQAGVSCALPSPVPGVEGATALAAGGGHTCAVMGESGGVLCWGAGDRGQIGDSGGEDRAAPTEVDGLTGVRAIGAGAAHTCAVLRSGRVHCWGDNLGGQLGDGSHDPRSRPEPVPGLGDAVAVVAGTGHTCALRRTGRVSCWGANGHGELGDGSRQERSGPVAVTGLADAVEVSAGRGHTCALRATGQVVCWGGSEDGQIGDGTRLSRPSPVPVTELSDAVDLAVGGFHGCARRRDGTVVCWGFGSTGQLGDGSSAGHVAPAPVSPVIGRTFTVEVAAAEGEAPARPTEMCTADVRAASVGGGCRMMISCSGRVLYGERTSGYGSCTVPEGQPLEVLFEDDSTSDDDGDPAVRLDTTAGRLSLRDGAEGEAWSVTLTVVEPPAPTAAAPAAAP